MSLPTRFGQKCVNIRVKCQIDTFTSHKYRPHMTESHTIAKYQQGTLSVTLPAVGSEVIQFACPICNETLQVVANSVSEARRKELQLFATISVVLLAVCVGFAYIILSGAVVDLPLPRWEKYLFIGTETLLGFLLLFPSYFTFRILLRKDSDDNRAFLELGSLKYDDTTPSACKVPFKHYVEELK